jgi:predicted nucleic acid-binding Zn ribbon protein
MDKVKEKNYCWFCGKSIPLNKTQCKDCQIIHSGDDGWDGTEARKED